MPGCTRQLNRCTGTRDVASVRTSYNRLAEIVNVCLNLCYSSVASRKETSEGYVVPRTQEYSDPHVCRLDETHGKGNRNEDIGREQITGRCHAVGLGCRLEMSNTAPRNAVGHSRGR